MAATPERVVVQDTTLLDGLRQPGVTASVAERVEIARALEALGVDVIEAGQPSASAVDAQTLRVVAAEVRGAAVCALARCDAAQIATAAEALRGAKHPRLHLFHDLGAVRPDESRQALLERVEASVRAARGEVADVQFTAADAGRADPELLAEVAARALGAGASVIGLADTAGWLLPAQLGALVGGLRERVPALSEATLAVRTYDDLGLAVSNALAGLVAGARQVEAAVHGLGPRAGSCALEEIVMALRARRDSLGLHTAVEARRLHPTSRLVSNVTGVRPSPNKAVVGQNAFAHEAAFVAAEGAPREVLRPEDVGYARAEIALGRHTGRHALRQRIRELGYHLDEVQLARVFREFKALAEKKRELFDADVDALARREMWSTPEDAWTLVAFHTSAGTGTLPTASVSLLRADGKKVDEAACGDGPVDAVFRAIERVTGIGARLSDFQIRSLSTGKDAQGEAVVEVQHEGRTHRGRAVSTDIIEAAVRAYLTVINRIARESRPAPESDALLAAASKA